MRIVGSLLWKRGPPRIKIRKRPSQGIVEQGGWQSLTGIKTPQGSYREGSPFSKIMDGGQILVMPKWLFALGGICRNFQPRPGGAGSGLGGTHPLDFTYAEVDLRFGRHLP